MARNNKEPNPTYLSILNDIIKTRDNILVIQNDVTSEEEHDMNGKAIEELNIIIHRIGVCIGLKSTEALCYMNK